MTTQTAGGSDFIKQLGRMYGTYTGGFIGFVILLAILEQVGVPNRILGYLFVFFTLAVYAVIGVMTRTAQLSEYYVAGRRVPAFYNGMATGADWMSAASFVGMAGTLFLLGYDGLAWVLGWTGGFVLVSILGSAPTCASSVHIQSPTSWRSGSAATRLASSLWSCWCAVPSPT